MITDITHFEYIKLLSKAMKSSKLVYLNCDIPEDLEGVQYFKSKEGISFLRPNGYMGGLCRIQEGTENIAKIHQQHRLDLGGHFLDCYDGKLVELYKSQGFKVIARIPFEEEYAKEGWETSNLKDKPNVVIMSILDKPLLITKSYDLAYKHGESKFKYLTMRYRQNLDKSIEEFTSLGAALYHLNKSQLDIKDIIDGFGWVDFSLEASRDLIRKSKYKIV